MEKQLIVRSLWALALALAAGCGNGGGATFGDMGKLPADCDSRCPAGYRCDDGVCVGGDAQALTFPVQTFPVAGTLTVDGQPPLATTSCSGDQVRVEFLEGLPVTSWFAPILSTAVTAKIACSDVHGDFAARLPAGTYHVYATRSDTNSSFPNATMVAQASLKVTGAAPNLTWNLPTVTVSGRLTVDGQPPVATSSCAGDHVMVSFLDDNGANFSTRIPCSEQNGAFSLRVAPGTYRVLAARSDTNTSFPDAVVVVQRSFQVSAATSGLAWNIPTVPLSGRITVDGQPPVATSSCAGDHVRLSWEDDKGASFSARIPCSEQNGAFSLRVSPGTYRVLAARSDTNTSFPDAVVVAQPSFNVTAAASGLTWNIPTVPVSGRITVDGQPPVATSSCAGDHVRLTFVDDHNATFSARILCSEQNGAFSLRVAPGTYRVLAARSDTNTSFPDAVAVAQPSYNVTAAASGLTWNIATRPVSGHITIDGQPPIATSGCAGDHVRFSFVDANGASFSTRILCSEQDGAFSLRVAPGTYRILASRSDANTSFPDATLSLVNALTIP